VSEFSRYRTVDEILNGAAVECGLTAATSAYSSEDVAFTQLRQLLLTAGQELIGGYSWQQLRREFSQTVLHGDSGSYALPPDFDRFLDQTQWNRTAQEILGGPASPQDWQALNGSQIVVQPLTVTWRLDNDYIKIYPVPPVTGIDPYATLYFEYISRAWVQDGTTSSVYRDYFIAGNDVLRYDSVLLIKMLKLRFLGAKGFATVDALNQYNQALSAAQNKVTPGEKLSLVPGSCANPQPWSGAINNGLPA
jgi:hypothetical protein